MNNDSYETNIAEMETARNDRSYLYFKARPELLNEQTQKAFDDGFVRGWEASQEKTECQI